ncbi:hypothetical protein EKPJFOCH_3065 [Methylobacterium thuringiense]|uniref:Uncharacterized protein n=1 Tax=Methylobacterium thuringiense TaxID=1003091 RepID=A0ABQ4TRQ0_9HYPH|nr:hypothetical protein EKPJFOCH_3065 [Methylobacterium thuringiense]
MRPDASDHAGVVGLRASVIVALRWGRVKASSAEIVRQ